MKPIRILVATAVCNCFSFIQAQAQEAVVMNPSIAEFFNSANKQNMKEKVEQFYAPDCVFEDPIVSIEGRGKILTHYQNLYENVKQVRFEIVTESSQNNQVFAQWIMSLNTPSLRGGETVVVKGVSQIRFQNGKAMYHRDYFDMGEMIYEHAPIVGWVIRKIKASLAPDFGS